MSDAPDFDENCDPANPRRCKYDDVLAASRRILGTVVRSPCTRANLSTKLGMELYLKQEFLQITGSFKERGARNALARLTEEQKRNGVISATTGNHGLALTYHALQVGVPFYIVTFMSCSKTKINKCIAMGAKVIFVGDNIAEAKSHAIQLAKEKKMLYINGYDHIHILEGAGTCGLEILEQVPDADAVLVPCGGGGLLAGVVTAIKYLKPDCEVYGLETEKTCSMVESLRKNERVVVPMEKTIADGLAVPMVGVNTFHTCKGLIDKMIVVKENWAVRAITHILEDEKFVVEGAGCLGVAACMAGLVPNLKGKKVVAILSGGNIDITSLNRSLERGLTAEGRLFKFKVVAIDNPGMLSDLCAMIAKFGVTLRDVTPERMWAKQDVFSVEIKCLVETSGWSQTKELIQLIKKNYKEYYFYDMEPDKTNKKDYHGPCLAPNPICMQK